MDDVIPLFQTEKQVRPMAFEGQQATESTRPWVPPPPRKNAPAAKTRHPSDPATEPDGRLQADALDALGNITVNGKKTKPPQPHEEGGDTPTLDSMDTTAVAGDPEAATVVTEEDRIRQAYVEGVQQGKKQAHAALERERTDLQKKVALAIHHLQQLTEDLSRTYRREAVDLAALIAKAVLGSDKVVDTDFIHTAVERVLTTLPRCQELVIQCHPDDVDTMVEHVPELKKLHGQFVTVHVSPDAKVERGGIVVDFGEGTLDTQPSVTVDVLREAIERELEQSHGAASSQATPPTDPQVHDSSTATEEPIEEEPAPTSELDTPSEVPSEEEVEPQVAQDGHTPDEPSEDTDR
jgi:flagellar biosynthesis/type III secretory pathway protein FliH